ncbi:MAG TPA: beta/gamma crystallin-related protein [Burkholderiaceae bacterium]|jgi:uncharacterized protein YcfJ|nr:beta/gamma crystallin-related protein [Burkholderiaceae bacterium]
MNRILKQALAAATLTLSAHAMADITFYGREGFEGRTFSVDRPVGNFKRFGFNDRASSVIVRAERGERWEVCEEPRFNGRCVVLRAGGYPSLASMGLNNQISSVRPIGRNLAVDDNRYANPPLPVYDARRRANERLFEARVTSVRAIVGNPEQRCWVEREEIATAGGGGSLGGANVPGALLGAVIGGVLGHQIGGGRGQDLATAGGAVAGAALGGNVNRGGSPSLPTSRDVRRCSNVSTNDRPEYWDVTYEFRGEVHRIQTTTPPGPTIMVNRLGEPRV